MTDYTFICYTHEDTRFAKKLAGELQRRGLEIWLDQWTAVDNAPWDRGGQKALQDCRHFLLVLSPAALNSWVVRDQTLLAVNQGKAIIPVICQTCSLPSILPAEPVIDFSHGQFSQRIEQLLTDVYGHFDQPRQPLQRPAATAPMRQLPSWSWPSAVVLILLALSAAIFYRWPRSAGEPALVPAEIEPVSLGEPVYVPTVDTFQAIDPQSTPIKTFRRTKDGNLMILIPAGDFLMGSAASDPDAGVDELPRHVVYLDEFWIDELEVSNYHYRQCLDAGGCSPPQLGSGLFIGDDLPVVGVNWEQAAEYCTWAGARLPTEAEWEKAARGVDGRLFPWGDEFDGALLNYCDANCVADWRDFGADDGYRYTAPVGSYPAGASPYGVLDMSGNVWEWTADWYGDDTYAQSIYKNPTGPETGLQRVIRGGSWFYPSKSLRVARRHKDIPNSAYDNIGFRCAVSPLQPVSIKDKGGS
ncbi:MAG: SUMF1/EgtB/PvdO family nonheme iron enzyme [Anaerolineae bacterium]|nr:SUMF1/EgtB/PvdO family nonheme iron enzyme [Anaerolineae bacterium]